LTASGTTQPYNFTVMVINLAKTGLRCNLGMFKLVGTRAWVCTSNLVAGGVGDKSSKTKQLGNILRLGSSLFPHIFTDPPLALQHGITNWRASSHASEHIGTCKTTLSRPTERRTPNLLLIPDSRIPIRQPSLCLTESILIYFSSLKANTIVLEESYMSIDFPDKSKKLNCMFRGYFRLF